MKKTNEAWFADTFNRPSTIACYAVDGTKLFDGAISTRDLSYGVDCATEADITCSVSASANNEYALAKGATNYTPSVEFIVRDEMSNAISSLQAQIDDLRQRLETKTASDELRSALKTLHYKREVE